MQPLDPSGSRADVGPLRLLSACDARTLLGKLRDLNLRDERLEVTRGHTVDVAGCLSLDAPSNDGLRYLLREKNGAERVLEITWQSGALEIVLDPGSGNGAVPPRRVPLLADLEGRAAAPEIRARVDPRSTNPREVEHFLRRLVRAAFASRN